MFDAAFLWPGVFMSIIRVKRVKRTVDGDSLEVFVLDPDTGFKIPAVMRVRVVGVHHGVDCAEMGSDCYCERQLARQQRRFTQHRLRRAGVINLVPTGVDKHKRLLAVVLLDSDKPRDVDCSLGDLLVKHAQAVAWKGRKHRWFDGCSGVVCLNPAGR